MGVLRYIDVAILVVAAPVMLLIGVPALGYGVGAGVWIVLRAVGAGVERLATASAPRSEVNLRLAYLLSRLFLLAIAVILIRKQAGQDDALAALCVIVFAFTVQLALAFGNGPRPR
ncbi:MAG: hypothetical protein M3018_05825 [Actinomycetota bacterium]|nr:hypothetical protein [Actinomycetota bacterium]